MSGYFGNRDLQTRKLQNIAILTWKTSLMMIAGQIFSKLATSRVLKNMT